VLLLVGAAGCGRTGASRVQDAARESTTRSLTAGHRIITNGLSLNGLSTNGLSTNGLNLNGLSTLAFRDWFNQDVTRHEELMRYLVQCAVPEGESRTFTQPETNQIYTWWGKLGLAPEWAGGQAATIEERQVVSACLAAHSNKYGLHVPISVLGLDGRGQPIAYSPQEVTDYRQREACFFGDLFQQEAVLFAGNDKFTLDKHESTTRVCGLSAADGTSQCSPMVHVGECSQYCQRDASGLYFTACIYNGINYRPITTRMRPEDIYRCGDRVCQATESCGMRNIPTHCRLDCGEC
jgi:hypothetical protein